MFVELSQSFKHDSNPKHIKVMHRFEVELDAIL